MTALSPKAGTLNAGLGISALCISGHSKNCFVPEKKDRLTAVL